MLSIKLLAAMYLSCIVHSNVRVCVRVCATRWPFLRSCLKFCFTGSTGCLCCGVPYQEPKTEADKEKAKKFIKCTSYGCKGLSEIVNRRFYLGGCLLSRSLVQLQVCQKPSTPLISKFRQCHRS